MAQGQGDIRQALDEALRCQRAGDFAAAEALYHRVLQDAPDWPVALHYAGVLAYQKGDLPRARALLQRALDGDDSRADFHCNFANLLNAEGQPEAAVSAYRQALARKPDHGPALTNLGAVLAVLGRETEAEAAFRQAAAVNPNNLRARIGLGEAWRRQGLFAQAIEAHRAAVVLSPRDPNAHYTLGLALEAGGQLDEARQAYRAALNLNPEQVDALVRLVRVLLEQRARGEAARLLEAALARRPDDFRLATLRAEIDNADGRFGEARARLERLVADDPDNAPAWEGLGRSLWALGRPVEAQEASRRALAIDDTRFNARFDLAVALFDDSAPQASAVEFERLVASHPDSGAARFYLGMLCEMMGDKAEAGRHFRTLLEAAPDLAFLVEGWSYVQTARDPETRLEACQFKTLEHALARAPALGLTLEFGVYAGNTLNFIAARSDALVHGFDSFQGIPEDWGLNPAGSYSMAGRLPAVADNVRLHVGWFEDTIRPFLAEQAGALRFANIDCDLYSSTRTVLEGLAGRVQPGSVLVFDEYIFNGRWKLDEHRAFLEAVERFGWRYRYLAFNPFSKQAAVRLE